MASAQLRFDRGTVRVDGSLPSRACIDGLLWDPRTNCWRAAAFRYQRLRRALQSTRAPFSDDLQRSLSVSTGPWRMPSLRPYQQEAVDGWQTFERRGVVVLPTGAGKTRVAIAAMAVAAATTLILCPTRALLTQWVAELRRWYQGPVGVVGDGERKVERVTVMTFESAYRQLDELGDRFGMLVVDETHHYGGVRGETLEMSAAAFRLGLTATAPEPGTPAADQLEVLVGPVVCRVGLGELVGTHLAELRVVHEAVKLEPDEMNEYVRLERPFVEMRNAFFRTNRGADLPSMLRALARTAHGRRAISDHHRAVGIASFPRAKGALVTTLLQRHHPTKTLVFTALANDAYQVALDNLIPIITAEIGRTERNEILTSFRKGRVRAIVSARVLNEGIDVPDATVGIVVAGTQGAREHVQRVGRVLRPAPGKRALVYELVTTGTLDDTRARARWRGHVA